MNEKQSAPATIIAVPNIVFYAGIMLAAIISSHYFPTRQASPITNILGLLVFLFTPSQEKRGFLRVVWPLFGILVLGIVSSYGHLPFDIFRDLSFAINAIMLMFIGYWLGGRKGMRTTFFKVFVFSALIIAGLHILKIVQNKEILNYGIEAIRQKTGTGNYLATVSFILLLFQNRVGIRNMLPRFVPRMLALALLATSLVLYFSRTDILVAIIFSLSIMGLLSKINIRMLLAGLLVVGGIIGLNAITPENETGTLRAKIKGSITEITIIEHDNYNANWRGFEAYRAVEMFKSANILQKTIGNGFGALVDLEFYILLGEAEMRYIPTIHNGYAYILVKVGLLGLILYAVFYFRIFRFGARNSFNPNPQMKFYSRMLVGCIWSLAIVMIFGGGMAQFAMPFIVMFLGFLTRVSHY